MNIYDVLIRDFPFLLKGLGVAIVLLAALLLIGFVLGMAICLIQLYGPKSRLVQWPSDHHHAVHILLRYFRRLGYFSIWCRYSCHGAALSSLPVADFS